MQQETTSNILSIRPFQFNPTQRVWITSEDNYLQKHYKRQNIKKLSQYLKRTPSAVSRRAHILGLKKIHYKKWSEEEHKYLRAAFPTGDTKEIAQKLNRTISAIKRKAYVLGLKKNYTAPPDQMLSQRPEKLMRMKPREDTWEDAQLTFLRQQFSQMSLEEMSQLIQRPKAEILSKLRQIFPVSTRRTLFYKSLTAKVTRLTLVGVNTETLQQIKDRALAIGQKWCQHPKSVCMRLIGYRLLMKGIITLVYNQITGTEDIPYHMEQMKIYRRRYQLRENLYGGTLG